jgi:uncharacterized protein YxeA
MAENMKVNELDFDSIKGNLKEFLKNQNQLKDFDFDGSSINILIDLLAYNTHYNAFYSNMVANEMFLDTATLRDSVVSRAKMLGYTPRSMASSKILVNIEIPVPTTTSPLPTSIIVPKYTKYKTVIDGKTYYFNTVQDHSAVQVRTEGSNYIFSTLNIYLYEGNKVEQKYVFDKNNPSQRMVLTNNNIDTSTLNVRVQRSATNLATTTFLKTVSITDLNSESPAYFLQEIEKELYEVYFGDGNMGRALEHNNLILIDYLTTNGIDANGASTFAYTTPIEGYEQQIRLVEGNTKSSGGAERETTESIRYLAPLNFNAQNRVVTSTDYKTAILQNYADVQAVTSWGGEENDPPIYGKVFIAMKPKTGFVINDIAKEQIKDSILKSRSVVSITPEIIDPSYIFIRPLINVYFSREVGSYSASDIEQFVKDAVLNFSQVELEQFNTYFRYSKFLRTIDSANPAIQNSSISMTLLKKLVITPNASKAYSTKFSNAIIYPHEGHFGSIYTNNFTYFGDAGCYLSDDGYGVINVYKLVVGERRLIDTNKGSVNYETGQVDIINFRPESVNDTELVVSIVPREQDIFSIRSQILEILEGDIVVNATDSQIRYTNKINSIYQAG